MKRVFQLKIIQLCLAGALGCSLIEAQKSELNCGGMLPTVMDPIQASEDFQSWLTSLNGLECAGGSGSTRPGQVSARSLLHKPSAKARREFDRGMKARRKGHAADAVAHFAAAARMDPAFVDAHAYAGLMYSEARQGPQALPYYQEAVRLEPTNAVLLSNLASVLMSMDRPADAEEFARRAVQLAPGSLEAHYAMGLALYARRQATQETLTHLAIAAEKYPNARETLKWLQEFIASSSAALRID